MRTECIQNHRDFVWYKEVKKKSRNKFRKLPLKWHKLFVHRFGARFRSALNNQQRKEKKRKKEQRTKRKRTHTHTHTLRTGKIIDIWCGGLHASNTRQKNGKRNAVKTDCDFGERNTFH